MLSKATDRGLTLIEILVVIVIMTIILTVVAISLSRLNSSQALDKGAMLVVSALDEARSLTLSAKNADKYGVYFEESRMILFKGETYTEGDPNNEENILNQKIKIRNITLAGGGSAVVFDRLTGNTSETGTMEVFLVETPTTFRTITVKATGVVELN